MQRPRLEVTPELLKKLKSLTKCDLDEYGREIPNPEPLFVSMDLEKPLTLQERIQRCLHTEFSRQAYDQGFESAEDAEDFDVVDDFEVELPVTVHEMEEEVLVEPETPPETPPPSEATEGDVSDPPPSETAVVDTPPAE